MPIHFAITDTEEVLVPLLLFALDLEETHLWISYNYQTHDFIFKNLEDEVDFHHTSGNFCVRRSRKEMCKSGSK